jgi:hypothetical protein
MLISCSVVEEVGGLLHTPVLGGPMEFYGKVSEKIIQKW